MAQLYCRDLRGGDIMLQANSGTVVNQAIRFGQQVMGRGSEQIVHAGIMFDNRFIVESAGAGVIANDLFAHGKIYYYQVFRCRNTALATGAGTCAKMFFDIHARSRTLKYSIPGAITSIFGKPGKPYTPDQMETAFDQLMKGRGHRFFCSQFVVYVYQYVAEQSGIAARNLFNLSDAKVPPSILASTLKQHSNFQEIGYMMPNQR